MIGTDISHNISYYMIVIITAMKYNEAKGKNTNSNLEMITYLASTSSKCEVYERLLVLN